MKTTQEQNSTIRENKQLIVLLFCFLLVYLGAYTLRACMVEVKTSLAQICTVVILGAFVNYIFPYRYKKFTLPFVFVVCAMLFIKGIWSYYILSGIVVMLCLLVIPYSLKVKISLITLLAIVVWAVLLTNFFSINTKFWGMLATAVGSVFMLRAISYLHEQSINSTKTPLIQHINYFLLPSNLAVPIFPVIDFKVFATSYYSVPAIETIRKGTVWFLLGILQYLVYKFIYHNLSVSPFNIDSSAKLVQYMMTQFLYVLRILGLFHISLGLICLYGYNLPEIFNHIFIANGFTDLWNRINIYWKEFVVKIFFYPIYFKIRKTSLPLKMFFVTLLCFVISWQLHSWQWLWIMRTFPVTATDAIFWISFGLLVATEAEWQSRAIPSFKQITAATPFIKAAQSVGVLAVMCILWSVWVSSSLNGWLQLFSNIELTQSDTLITVAIFVVWWLAVVLYYFLFYKKPSWIVNNHKLTIGLFVAVCVFMHSRAHLWAEELSHLKFREIKTTNLNQADKDFEERSYYNNLLAGRNMVLSSKTALDKTQWSTSVYPLLIRYPGNVLRYDYLPNKKLTINSLDIRTNECGMRDKTYTKAKPDSVYRIILAGGSIEMGQGVSNDDVFEQVAEDKLSQLSFKDSAGKNIKVELLNFSVNGYRLNKVVPLLELKALEFEPNVLLTFRYTNDEVNLAVKMAQDIDRKWENVNDTFLLNIFSKHRLTDLSSEKRIAAVLTNEYVQIDNWYSTKIKTYCNEYNITPVSVFLPVPLDSVNKQEYEYLKTNAAKHGFEFWDMSHWYKNLLHNTLTLTKTDIHPNPEGHRMLADKFYQLILAHLRSKGIKPVNNNSEVSTNTN